MAALEDSCWDSENQEQTLTLTLKQSTSRGTRVCISKLTRNVLQEAPGTPLFRAGETVMVDVPSDPHRVRSALQGQVGGPVPLVNCVSTVQCRVEGRLKIYTKLCFQIAVRSACLQDKQPGRTPQNMRSQPQSHLIKAKGLHFCTAACFL